MYPRTYYETFMRYEANNEVFVAMPFTDSFKHAFEEVIEPAIVRVTVNGKQLVPRIINRATSGATDIHEKIFDAITHSRLVIADMTVQASYIGDAWQPRWQANANVAYEVGLASAWRNPEDILLLHQAHENHSYSFDVQNLRHFTYDPSERNFIATLASEIVAALNQSSFLAKLSYQKILESVSPSAIQFMHQEAPCRAFPVIAFLNEGMSIMDARLHAITELLTCGALKNRNVFRQGEGKGVAIIYEWTLGLRMLVSLYATSLDRRNELAAQMRSVPSGEIPPASLRELPDASQSPPQREIDMTDAVKVDTSTDDASQQDHPNGAA